MAVARIFHVAQPALLYIVPSTLCPIIFRAWLLGSAQMQLVWRGFQERSNDSAATFSAA